MIVLKNNKLQIGTEVDNVGTLCPPPSFHTLGSRPRTQGPWGTATVFPTITTPSFWPRLEARRPEEILIVGTLRRPMSPAFKRQVTGIFSHRASSQTHFSGSISQVGCGGLLAGHPHHCCLLLSKFSVSSDLSAFLMLWVNPYRARSKSFPVCLFPVPCAPSLPTCTLALVEGGGVPRGRHSEALVSLCYSTRVV